MPSQEKNLLKNLFEHKSTRETQWSLLRESCSARKSGMSQMEEREANFSVKQWTSIGLMRRRRATDEILTTWRSPWAGIPVYDRSTPVYPRPPTSPWSLPRMGSRTSSPFRSRRSAPVPLFPGKKEEKNPCESTKTAKRNPDLRVSGLTYRDVRHQVLRYEVIVNLLIPEWHS